MSEHKHEYDPPKEFVDEKVDIERQSVVLEEEENSPIPEVAAIVSNKDDPSLPVLTFRFWVMGTVFTLVLAFINQFFYLRNNPMTITSMAVQLLAYPIGKFMARVLPSGILNPGPFNVKEHVVIAMTANCAANAAYAVDITIIQKVFYHQDFGFLANIMLIFSTQMLGYGLAGVLRRYLVYPAAMIWPATLVQVAMFDTLHQDEDLTPGQWSRYKFFMIVTFGVFVYHWFPEFIFPVMGTVAWVCWINPKSLLLSQLGGSAGLGLGAITLDWNTVIAYLTSPLVAPWWAQANIMIGFVITAWILVPLTYYTNLWNSQRFPIITSKLYRENGEAYVVTDVLTSNQLNETKYDAYGSLRISGFFALTYGIGFAGLTSMITHTWLYHRHKLVAQWKQSREHSEDIHHKLMQAYPEVPDWWYFSIFAFMTAISIIGCEVYDYYLPWWAVLLAIALCCIFVLPVGLIQALTNQSPGLNIITEYVIGYILPGRPIANVTFKTLGYISMSQALTFVSDLKLGHYMKVPPRAMFWAQLFGTVLAGIVNLLTADWLLKTQENFCDPESDTFSCPNTNVFYSASVIWGVISPNRMFGPSSAYKVVNYFFLVGLVLPIPFFYLKKAFPNTWMENIHIPIILGATGMMPPAKPFHYFNWLVVGFIFQYYVRRYHPDWHLRFTYVLSASLETGCCLTGLAIFAFFTSTKTEMAAWWGNQQPGELCPLQNEPTIPLGTPL
ncbi:hypothetical protein BGX21_001722 [Mortierella sp. AD011]|nr:hypothetical protein BGX20_001555 [Mortierella sp. AD010]KAF9382825.1 hypothetical protein BGX21_001722 [Mortierella sp. AD011]